MSMLTRTYPPPRTIKVTICNHQVNRPVQLWPDVCFGDLQAKNKSVVIHGTECPYRDQVSLNNTKLKLKLSAVCIIIFHCEFFCSFNEKSYILTLKVLVATIDALGHFETG